MLSRFSSSTTFEIRSLGPIVDAVGPYVPVVSLHGGPYVLTEVFISSLGNRYQQKMTEYATFDLFMLMRCLRRIAASVFVDPYSMTALFVNRLKSAESRGLMSFHLALKKAIFTSNHAMPQRVLAMANIFGVWPLFFFCLKERGEQVDGNNIVESSFTAFLLNNISDLCVLCS